MLERTNRLTQARQLLAQLPAPADIADRDLRNEASSVTAVIAERDRDLTRSRALLEQLVADQDKDPRAACEPYFALGRVRDKLGDIEGAMHALQRAHAIQLRSAELVVPQLLAPGVKPLSASAARVDRAKYQLWPQLPAPSTQESPVFIVGFPRSGTTLLEQILDAHPQLRSMDERAFLQNVVDRMSDFACRYPDDLGALSSAQCDDLRQLYINLASAVAPRAIGQRIVDKNPLNLLRLPLIYRLFPNARIILALRHPCDVILSCYMQTFRSPAYAVLCSSLERLVQGYVIAMQFWLDQTAVFKPTVMELRYEDLLTDFSGHVDRIGDFIGLHDTGQMLSYHEHALRKGYIATPSYSQVIEPPHKRAVNRWHPYRKFFEPFLPQLKTIMDHWGYDS